MIAMQRQEASIVASLYRLIPVFVFVSRTSAVEFEPALRRQVHDREQLVQAHR
jgi:hypothetical protein